MAKGWIKLHRQIMDNGLYYDKPFCRSMAFIDLLLLANHEDREIFFNGNLITVESGSFITSYEKMSDRWGWSTTKIRKFLKELIKQGAITTESDEKKTVISLVNYRVYQGSEHTENIHKTYREHTEVIQKNTNKNVKNDNNEKNDIDKAEKSEIYFKASTENIKDMIIHKHAIFKFIGSLTKDEIFQCIERSSGKHALYLVQVLQTKVEDKQKPKQPPRPVAVQKTKKNQPSMAKAPEYEPLTDEQLNEMYKLAEILDKGGNDN